MSNVVLLIAGTKGSGKSTAAKRICEVLSDGPGLKIDCLRISFADELRRHLSILNPIVEPNWSGRSFRWNEAIQSFGYDEAKKKFPEMRRLMQTYGTEVIRDNIDPNFWAIKTIEAIEDFFRGKDGCLAIIDDLRFKNELFACIQSTFLNFKLSHNPIVYKLLLIKPEQDTDTQKSKEEAYHVSEDLNWINDYRSFYEISNDFNKENFYEKIDKCIAEYISKR